MTKGPYIPAFTVRFQKKAVSGDHKILNQHSNSLITKGGQNNIMAFESAFSILTATY